MNDLGILSVKVGKDNDRKVKANEKIPFVFTFTRPLKEGETVDVECHMFEKQFQENRTIGTFTLTSKPPQANKWIILNEPPSCDSDPIHITLPEEMAGATVKINFSMKLDITKKFAYSTPFLYFTSVTVEIGSSEGRPKIEAIHWSDTKEVRFGKLSAARTDALLKNETVYLHIHTRGMYGKQVVCKRIDSLDIFSRAVLVKNNVVVLDYTFKDESTNQIKMSCSPFAFSLIMGKTVSIPYIHNEELVIATRTLPVFSYPHVPKKKDFASQAKCRVDFRPLPAYDGSFGFSWYRIGDMNGAPGYSVNTRNYRRTNQSITTNRPCNDHPFSETDFPGTGILGRHYETVSDWIFWTKNRVVQNINNSGTGSGVNYPTAGTRNNFIADATMAADHKKDYPKITLMGYTDAEPLMKEYLAPVMTLVCGKTAQFRVFLHVKEEPEEILFVFDNPRAETDGILTVDVQAPIQSPAVTSGSTRNYAHTLTITCNKPFDKELRLKAYAVPKGAKKGMVKKENGRLKLYPEEGKPLVLPELCGMLRILPNDDAHWREIDVIFFNVKTNLENKTDPKDGLDFTTRIEVGPLMPGDAPLVPLTPTPLLPSSHPPAPPPTLPPLLPPPVTSLPSPYFTMPVFPSLPPQPIIKKGDPKQEKHLHRFLAQAYVKANIVIKDIDLSKSTSYEGLCIDSDHDGILDKFDYNDSNASKLRKLLTDHPLSVQYETLNYIRLYFMPDKATTVNGFSSPGKNFTISFAGATNATPTHELGHTMGLPHTFTGNTDQGARYTYEDGKTDNIMDYCHQIGIDRQSFLHWQWETLNTNLNK